jgi:hypothetical protein
MYICTMRLDPLPAPRAVAAAEAVAAAALRRREDDAARKADLVEREMRAIADAAADRERRAAQEAADFQAALKLSQELEREDRGGSVAGGGSGGAAAVVRKPPGLAFGPPAQHLMSNEPPLPSRKPVAPAAPAPSEVDSDMMSVPNAQSASAAGDPASTVVISSHAFDWVDLALYPIGASDAARLQAAVCFVQAAGRALLARHGRPVPRLSAARRKTVTNAVQRMPLRELGDMAPLGKLGVRAPVCQLLGSLMNKGAGPGVLADWLDQSFQAQNSDDLYMIYEYFDIVLTRFCDFDAYAHVAAPSSSASSSLAAAPARATVGSDSMRVLKKGGDDDDFSMFAGSGKQGKKK